MAQVLLVLAQVGLLLCWYLVPAFAAVSAWLIFLPTILLVGMWMVTIGIIGLYYGLTAWWVSR